MFVCIVCGEGPGCRGTGKAKRYSSPQVLLLSLPWIMAFICLPGATVGGLPISMPKIGSVDGGSAPAKEQGRGERQGLFRVFPWPLAPSWATGLLDCFSSGWRRLLVLCGKWAEMLA